MKFGLWSCVVLALLLIEVVYCDIRCYVCNTQTGLYKDECNDDFRLTSIATSSCQGSCLKTRGYRNVGGRDIVEIFRGCVTRADDDCHGGDYNGIEAEICTCSEDLCNSGPSLIVSRWTGWIIGLCSILINIAINF